MNREQLFDMREHESVSAKKLRLQRNFREASKEWSKAVAKTKAAAIMQQVHHQFTESDDHEQLPD